jgi:para-aminobenzoate synthetase component 1
MDRFQAAPREGLPPFQGGAAGLMSYELGRQFERVPPARFDEFGLPALAVGLYDVVVAFDHQQGRAWIISQGFPETEPAARARRARERLEEFRARIESEVEGSGFRVQGSAENGGAEVLNPESSILFPVSGPDGLTSNFTRGQYLAAVQRAIDYIYAGDVFQVNLSQRLLFPAVGSGAVNLPASGSARTRSSLELYLRLRRRNPATFAGYFDMGDFQIVSASPERFLRVRVREVEARPIKGTRRRSHQPEADLYAGSDLLASEKDRAENVMIVDLLRNDLSRVCTPDSVRVTQLCEVEIYEYVQHLVSAVRGELREGCGPLDLVRAAFPGGSITGAPKVRAMEIIAELEPTARGAYCGSLGYLGFDGALDLSILIRTITAGRGWWQFPVGGGIVAQSDPEAEYEETWHKAEGLLRALV